MPTGLYQTVAVLPQITGIAGDDVNNVWHFFNASDDDHATVQADIVAKLTRFYNTDIGAGMTVAMANYLGDSLSRVASACSFVTYFTDDLSGASPFGSPVAMTNWTLGASSGGTEFPSEIAAVLSIHGVLTDVPETAPNPTPPPPIIRPASRRRGRIYFGPVNNSSATGGDPARISGTFMADAAAICEDLANASDALTSWVVWSKMDIAVFQVVGGFIENAYDVQRRRGPAASSRTTWAV